MRLLVNKFLLFSSEQLLIILLVIMFIDYAGYGYYYFYLPFLYLLLHRINCYVDKLFLLIVIWGIFHAFAYFIHTMSIGYATSFMYFVNFPILYLAGKYLVNKFDDIHLLMIFYVLVLSIALLSSISVVKDVAEHGFIVVGAGRNIPLIGINNPEGYIAATGISSRLILLLSFIGFIFVPCRKSMKIVFVAGAILAIYCALRVQSRTSVIALLLILIISIYINAKINRKTLLLLLLTVIALCILFQYIYINYGDQLIVLHRFETDEVESGGGRLEPLVNVFCNLIVYPVGGMFLNDNVMYAHNIWLDCGRVSGIIPFVLLIIITLKYYSLLRSFMKNKVCFELKFATIILSCVLLIAFLSEPVLEGIPMVFAFFCLLLGVLKGYSIKNSVILVKYE